MTKAGIHQSIFDTAMTIFGLGTFTENHATAAKQ